LLGEPESGTDRHAGQNQIGAMPLPADRGEEGDDEDTGQKPGDLVDERVDGVAGHRGDLGQRATREIGVDLVQNP
jgi:hypothetical protein